MLKVIELFAGIGSQTQALKNLGIEHEVIGISEIDKYAIKSYEAIHGEVNNFGDIAKIEKLPYCDLLTYSFPCQDISIAGKQEGIKEGTRSGLLYEVERLLERMEEKPKYLLLENVKNLVGKKHIQDFAEWLLKLEKMGYENFYKVLNTKDYGIPQNRERVFCVSIKKDLNQNYSFPQVFDNGIRLKHMLENKVDEKYYLKQKGIEYVTDKKRLEKMYTQIDGEIALCHTAVGQTNWTGTFISENKIMQVGMLDIKGNEQVRRVYSDQGLSPTLTSAGADEKILTDYRIRKLTPKECWRLQGFKDEEFEKAEKVCSNSQLYKQAGNSITVNVLEAIFKNLF